MSSPVRALPMALFPPVHWWVAALSEDVFLDVHRTYYKQTLRNRMTILTSNGVAQLSIPVNSTKGQATPHSEIRMAEGKWRLEHLHAIRSAYGRAAYFEHYYPIIENVYASPNDYLHIFAQSTAAILMESFKKKGIVFQHTEKGQSELDEMASRALSAQLEPSYAGIIEPGYPQVFSDRFAFQHNLSYIDLMMNKGPEAIDYIFFIKNGYTPV
jgi:hypothetical protein